MKPNLLKSGICPECGSKEVYTNENLPDRGDRRQLAISSFKCLLINCYLCTVCGHFEEYVSGKDMKDMDIIDKLKSSWEKV